MSWNGTVRCGWCGQKGHNKRSCPDLKKYVEENPDGWRAQQYNASKAKGKVRRCTYCNLKGHNRRTCPSLKQHKQEWKEKTAAWREEFVEWAASVGLAQGALIKVPSGYNETAVRILGGFDWSALNPEVQQTSYPHQAMRLRLLKDPAGLRWNRSHRLPHHETLVPDAQTIEIVGPVKVTKEELIASAPEWFMAGNTRDDLKDVFDGDRKHPNHYENGWVD